MNFALNDEQQLLQDSARKLLQAECAFERRGPLVAAGSFDERRWKRYAEMGWLGLTVPEDGGGLGLGPVEMCLVMEEIGRALCVEPIWAVGVVAAQLLVAVGASPVVDDLLSGVIDGTRRVVLAHGEADALGCTEHVATQAQATAPGRWVLNGEKSLVVGGNVADRLIVSARTGGSIRDVEGISLFVLDPGAAGVVRRDVRLVDNRWAMHLTLEGVAVGEAELLGPVGKAHGALDQAMAHGLVGLCAEAIGLMEQALWTTRDYLKLRKQFGVSLATFQVLQHRMSDMLIELELSRSMLYRAISCLSRGVDERNTALSALKYHIGRSGRFVCGQAIQLHGAIGVTEECIIGHYFKRMTLIDNALGHSFHHLERLAQRELLGVD